MELVNFIKTHENWEDLLTKAPYHIKITRDKGLIMFKYNQLNSDFSLPIVRECRGCILRESDYKVICHAFDKFGNYGESYVPKLEGNLTVLEKIDGSLIKAWKLDGELHISTNGAINAYNAPFNDSVFLSFGSAVEYAVNFAGIEIEDFADLCEEGFTWMFELVSPHNRIVIPYENTELFYLGCRNNETGEEFGPYVNSAFGEYFNLPQRYEMNTLNDIIEASKALDWADEGYVVYDKNYNRVKVKSPEYVKAHYLRANNSISEKKLLEVVLTNEIEEFLTYCSDYAEKIYEIQKKMKNTREAGEKLRNDKPPAADYQWILQFPQPYRSFLFSNMTWDEWAATRNLSFWSKYLLS